MIGVRPPVQAAAQEVGECFQKALRMPKANPGEPLPIRVQPRRRADARLLANATETAFARRMVCLVARRKGCTVEGQRPRSGTTDQVAEDVVAVDEDWPAGAWALPFGPPMPRPPPGPPAFSVMVFRSELTSSMTLAPALVPWTS